MSDQTMNDVLAERDAALARVAELESENAEMKRQLWVDHEMLRRNLTALPITTQNDADGQQ